MLCARRVSFLCVNMMLRIDAVFGVKFVPHVLHFISPRARAHHHVRLVRCSQSLVLLLFLSSQRLLFFILSSFVRRHHHSRSERRNPFASNDERPARGGSRGARVRAEQIPETQPTVRAFGPDIHVAIFIQLRVHQETNERGIVFEQHIR